MIKLVAFDVDGTLRDRDYLPVSTKLAVQQLMNNGVTVALCTGRSEHEMASLREELGIEWAITCNGSHVARNGSVVHGHAFDSSVIDKWLKAAEQMNHTVLMYGSERMYLNRSDAPLFLQAQQEIGFMQPDLLSDLSQDAEMPNLYQVIIFCEEHDQKVYLAEYGDQYYTHRWRQWAFDINPQGMNKAVGLKWLIDHLGLRTEEVAAFGDGLNDLEMIQSVGMGIAMGNGIDLLKEKARYVTTSLNEGGIAYAVEHYLNTPTRM